MPFFRFKCSACDASLKKLLRNKLEAENYSGGCDICGSPVVQTLGTPDKQELVTVDEDRGKKHVDGIEEMIDERAKDHFRKVQLPRMIEERGMDYVKENGFVDEDGKPK